jgi:hypothetical protein
MGSTCLGFREAKLGGEAVRVRVLCIDRVVLEAKEMVSNGATCTR